jgi:hypothetical protein
MSTQNTINEKPILFNSDMVRAVLEGRKTQTRRVVKPQPFIEDWEFCADKWQVSGNEACAVTCTDSKQTIKCPYGAVGDQLWVRESFWQRGRYHEPYPGAENDDYEWIWTHGDEIKYAATDVLPNGSYQEYHKRPSIFMFRKDSRIQLEITGVRVERVQDITAEDALAEGIENVWDKGDNSTYTTDELLDMYHVFRKLWDSINGNPRKDGVDTSWAANPWVWVVEFKKIERSS